MKKLTFVVFVSLGYFQLSGQAQEISFNNCFGKSNRQSINKKMESLLKQINDETGCIESKVTYTIDDYYTTFYTKKCRHLPKRITVDACGETLTYVHDGLSGAVLHWLLGSWTLSNERNYLKEQKE